MAKPPSQCFSDLYDLATQDLTKNIKRGVLTRNGNHSFIQVVNVTRSKKDIAPNGDTSSPPAAIYVRFQVAETSWKHHKATNDGSTTTQISRRVPDWNKLDKVTVVRMLPTSKAEMVFNVAYQEDTSTSWDYGDGGTTTSKLVIELE